MGSEAVKKNASAMCSFLLLAGALGVSLAGCEEEIPGPISIDISGSTVEIGQGIEAFTALPDLSEIRLFRGSQGGQHIIGNFQISLDDGSLIGGDIEGVTARFSVMNEDGEELSIQLPPFRPDFVEVRPGVVTLRAGRYIFMDGLKSQGLDGQAVVMGVEVFVDGDMRADYRTVFVDDPGVLGDDPTPGQLDAFLHETAVLD